MFSSGRSSSFWRVGLFVCLTLVLSGFRSESSPELSPESEVFQAAIADQTIYFIQWGTPAAIPNFVDLAAGCNWSGIGGQVFDQAGTPVAGLRVRISGTYDGRQISQVINTGSSQRFGPGGFELKLGDRPVASQTVRLQLINASGSRLSPPYLQKTFATCQQNLLVMNLKQITLDHLVFLPQVPRY